MFHALVGSNYVYTQNGLVTSVRDRPTPPAMRRTSPGDRFSDQEIKYACISATGITLDRERRRVFEERADYDDVQLADGLSLMQFKRLRHRGAGQTLRTSF